MAAAMPLTHGRPDHPFVDNRLTGIPLSEALIARALSRGHPPTHDVPHP
jgi:hypothetical protein